MSVGKDLTPCLNDLWTLCGRQVSLFKTTHLFNQNILQGSVETSNLHSVHPFPNAGGDLGLTLAL